MLCEMCGASFEPLSNKGVTPRFCLACRSKRAAEMRNRRRRGEEDAGQELAEAVVAPADPDAPPGPIETALLVDFDVVPVGATVLFEAARLLARRLDAGPPDRDVASISREFRQLVAALRTSAVAGRSELDDFLDSIRAEGF